MKVEHPWQNTKTNLSGSHYCSLDTNDEMEQFLKDDLISKSQSQKFNQMLVSDFFLTKYTHFFPRLQLLCPICSDVKDSVGFRLVQKMKPLIWLKMMSFSWKNLPEI